MQGLLSGCVKLTCMYLAHHELESFVIIVYLFLLFYYRY